MGPASLSEIRQRDAFCARTWELGHYRRRGGVPPMQRERPGKGAATAGRLQDRVRQEGLAPLVPANGWAAEKACWDAWITNPSSLARALRLRFDKLPSTS